MYPTESKGIDREKPARLTNGYVGAPLASTISTISVPALDMYFYYPTDEQFDNFPTGTNKVNPDNKEYLIACDVSGYTDYMEKFERNKDSFFGGGKGGDSYIEPTLSHRVIYCIRAIENEEDWRHKFFDEQKNKPETEAKYLEEYEINMPATRIPTKRRKRYVLQPLLMRMQFQLKQKRIQRPFLSSWKTEKRVTHRE